MSQYTTGELARICGVSVRTVQFYDEKDLLKPSEISEGGRRLYSNEDLSRLQLICMLKALGLKLATIKGILSGDNSEKVLLLILDEQANQIDNEIQDRQKQLNAIQIIKDHIRNTGRIPTNSIGDIERMMDSKKKLKKTHLTMLAIGMLMDAVLITTVIIGFVKGLWWPLIIGMPLVILMGILITRLYYKNTEYICAECNIRFKPTLFKFFFSRHTPKARKLECPKCGHIGYCVEVGTEVLK